LWFSQKSGGTANVYRPAFGDENHPLININEKRRMKSPPRRFQNQNGGWMQFDFPRTFRNHGDCIQARQYRQIKLPHLRR